MPTVSVASIRVTVAQVVIVVSLLLLFVASPALAELGRIRELLRNDQGDKATEVISGLLAQKPKDPWLLYNAGVVAYARKDYAKADAYWQQLATMELPEALRKQVWLQIGNVSFRLAETSLKRQSESAVANLEQSREAYHVALSQNPEAGPARKNLAFVEGQLEGLYVDLAKRLVSDAGREKAHERAIGQLRAALDYQQKATGLDPKDPRHPHAEREIQQKLAARFLKKAEDEEQQGDRIAGQKTLDQSKLSTARQEFEKAIADFKQAQAFDQEMQQAEEGPKRVTGKLANMFAKAGRQEQREGNARAKQNPTKALESYGAALDYFDTALEVQSDHQDALAGRQEVKEAMERLHLQQGDQLVKAGEAQLKKEPAEAVENLLGALGHFEQAKALNPENPTIPPRIEHVQKLLPDALVAMGQREQKYAKEAEATSVENAIAHLEQAESLYLRALQLAPDHQQAQEGLRQVREDLERLRKKLPPPDPVSDEQQNTRNKSEDQSSFASMLERVKAKQQEREITLRRQMGATYDPARATGIKSW